METHQIETEVSVDAGKKSRDINANGMMIGKVKVIPQGTHLKSGSVVTTMIGNSMVMALSVVEINPIETRMSAGDGQSNHGKNRHFFSPVSVVTTMIGDLMVMTLSVVGINPIETSMSAGDGLSMDHAMTLSVMGIRPIGTEVGIGAGQSNQGINANGMVIGTVMAMPEGTSQMTGIAMTMATTGGKIIRTGLNVIKFTT